MSSRRPQKTCTIQLQKERRRKQRHKFNNRRVFVCGKISKRMKRVREFWCFEKELTRTRGVDDKARASSPLTIFSARKIFPFLKQNKNWSTNYEYRTIIHRRLFPHSSFPKSKLSHKAAAYRKTPIHSQKEKVSIFILRTSSTERIKIAKYETTKQWSQQKSLGRKAKIFFFWAFFSFFTSCYDSLLSIDVWSKRERMYPWKRHTIK